MKVVESAKTRIMCVDDCAANNYIIHEILDEHFDVLTVNSAKSCLEKIKEFRPELILLDVMMPEIDGYELIFMLKNNPETKLIKVVFLSAKSTTEDKVGGLEAGAHAYMVKPFEPKELLANINSLLKLNSKQGIDIAKKQLAQLIAHETRTPINGIVGNVSLLKDAENLTNFQKECVDDIMKAAMTLLKFSNNALLLVHMDASTKVNTEKVIYNPLLTDVITELEREASKKSITITYTSSFENDLFLYLNKALILMALNIIIENAIKHSSENNKIEIISECDNDVVHTSIIDHGGVDSDVDVDDIFRMFAVKDINHHSTGPGLSLSIVKQILSVHQGSVAATKTDNGGTTIQISFPRISNPK